MSESGSVPFPPRRLVVAVDLSPSADQAISYALSLGEAVSAESVDIVTVGARSGDEVRIESTDGLVTMARRAAKALVETHVRRVATDAGLSGALSRTEAHVLEGSPANGVVKFAADRDADLIVVGTHSRKGVTRALLGSVAEQIARLAGCPVVVVRSKQHEATQ